MSDQDKSARQGVREAVAAAVAGRFGMTETHRMFLREQEAEERAAHQLLLAMPVRLAEVVQAEVERRTAVFQAVRETSPRTPPVWPRRAALESVTADLIAGRL